MGDTAILSFGRGKGWTGGTGGAILMSNSAGLPSSEFLEAEFSRRVAVSIGVAAQWALARPEIYGLPVSIPALRLGETTYWPPRPVRAMTRVAATTLLATHEASRKEANLRQSNAIALIAAIGDSPQVRPIPAQSCRAAGYLRLPVRGSQGYGEFSECAACPPFGNNSELPDVSCGAASVSWKTRCTRR